MLYVKPSRIHRRRFDASGNEIESNFSDTKKVNTGFLMSSYSEYVELMFALGEERRSCAAECCIFLVCLKTLQMTKVCTECVSITVVINTHTTNPKENPV